MPFWNAAIACARSRRKVKYIAQRLIRQSVGRVEFFGFEGNAVTLFEFFLGDLRPQHVDKYSSLVHQAGCQARHGIDAVGVQHQNLAKELFLLLQVFQSPGFGSQGHSAEQQVARLRVGFARFALAGGRDDDLPPDGVGDARGDPVLQRKQVGAVAIEGLGPELPAGGGVGQLGIDADFFTAALHIALQGVAHAQILAHLLDIDLLVLKRVRSRRGNHKEPRRA